MFFHFKQLEATLLEELEKLFLFLCDGFAFDSKSLCFKE